MGIGSLGGTVAGALVGFVIGLNTTEETNSGRHSTGEEGIYALFGSCIGGCTGVLLGAAIGATLGEWENIHFIYRLENKNP